MIRFFKPLFRPFGAIVSLLLLLTGLAFLVSTDHVIRERKLPPHPYVLAGSDIQTRLREDPPPHGNRLFIYFVDSLRFDYALNPELMPHLNRLLPESTWGLAVPCATNMTVHCVEAAFSGIDRSSILAFGEDFHPKRSKHSTGWFFQMKNRGAHIAAVSDYVIPTLYPDALAEKHEYRKGASQRKLVEMALGYFANPANTVTIVHLLGPHDEGQIHGSNTPQYRAQLREVDDLLRDITATLSPKDTLFIFGDHGMDDEGKHTYNTYAPTFYLYRGPDFTPGLRQDIHLLSHTFFLSVLFRLPFFPDYQGDFYWNAFQPEIRDIYGPEEIRSLAREKTSDRIQLPAGKILRFGVLILLWFAGFVLLFGESREPPKRVGIPWAIGSIALLHFGWIWPLLVSLGGMAAWMLVHNRPKGTTVWLAALGIFITGVIRGVSYRPFDMAVHEMRIFYTYGFYFLELALGYALAGFLFAPRNWRERLWQGTLLAGLIVPVLHFPSLYAYGFLRSLPFFLTAHLAASLLWIAGPEGPVAGHKKPLLTGLTGACILLLIPQHSMFVENFRIFDFPLLPHREGATWNMAYALVPFTLTSAFLLARARLGVRGMTAAGLLVTAAASTWLLGEHLSPFFYAGLFGTIVLWWVVPIPSLPGSVRHLVAFAGTQMLLAYMYSFSLQVFYQVNLVFLVAFTLLELQRHIGHEAKGLIAIMGLFLMVLSFVVFFSFRTCGIDFRFALAWFPNLFETLWFLVFGATVLKYFSPAFLLAAQEATFGRKLPFDPLLRFGFLLTWLLLPLLLTLLVLSEKVPLIVDTLEEGMYLLGVPLMLLLTRALPVFAFRGTDRGTAGESSV